jgi:adenine-specific DNA-methyltransferase
MRGKLELTWVGKDERPRLEPRVLVEDPSKSYGDPNSENILIFGDNLLALKALEQDFAGQIKCIYIDPPFNTGQAFEHYDDGVEHSIWLTMMRERLVLLHRLLHRSGSLFIHIDDNELGYLVALTDEVFGRRNKVSVIAFKQSSVSGPKAINPGIVTTSNFILYYARDKEHWSPNRVYAPTQRDSRYSKYVVNYNEPYSTWRLVSLSEALAAEKGLTVRELRKQLGEGRETELTRFVLKQPERVVRTARVAPRDVNAEARAQLENSKNKPGVVFRSERADKSDYYFLNGEQLLFYSAKTRVVDGNAITAEAISNIWDDLLSNNLHNEGGVNFPNGKKPEALLKRVLELSTSPGDWVLDSFGGSGTTGAVAHKMDRRWILVELLEHCHTHIEPRLRRVVSGQDDTGISSQGASGLHREPALRHEDADSGHLQD